MAVTWHDTELHQRGLLTVYFSGKDAGMTWMMQKETVKGEFRLLQFLSGTKLLHFGAFKVIVRFFRGSSLRRRHARQRAAGRAGRRAQWEVWYFNHA